MAGEDPDYIHWLHGEACACHPCASRVEQIEANHSTAASTSYGRKGLGGKKGLGQRSHDKDAFPLCGKHHHQFTRVRDKGYFAGWTREQVNAWQIEQSRKYRAKYEVELAAGRVVVAHPDDKNLPKNARRSGVIDFIQKTRELCQRLGVGEQGTLEIVRHVREALDWGIR